ncbi:hypothetical protein DFQ26_004145 [Actinomortierella ambigua]|nr:hypothetical protein DFQ26_004145 [Actinomortierella ambigua]
MKRFGAALAGLAFLFVTTAFPTNDTFAAYVVKNGTLALITEPPSPDVRTYHNPPSTNTTAKQPQNFPGNCISQDQYDYEVDATSKFWGIDNNRRNIYDSVSKLTICGEGVCDIVATDTVTKTATGRVAGDATFDVMAVKIKLGFDKSVQTSTVRSISHKLQIREGKAGYMGFAASWIEVFGTRKMFRHTCCGLGHCSKIDKGSSGYKAYLPKSMADSREADGVYNICLGEGETQKCNPDGADDILTCKGDKGTNISGQRLQGCKDNDCADSSRILVSSNNANKVAIHTNGNMCVYGTRDGRYSNTWCTGKSMDSSKGPFYGSLHQNGNFCLYTKAGSNYWCSGKTSTSHGQYRAIIQNDGNFVIYTAFNNPIWSSETPFGKIPFPSCGLDNGGSSKCHGGNPGKGDGKGGEGACCKTERDCDQCCTDGVCNAACNFKRSVLEYH